MGVHAFCLQKQRRKQKEHRQDRPCLYGPCSLRTPEEQRVRISWQTVRNGDYFSASLWSMHRFFNVLKGESLSHPFLTSCVWRQGGASLVVVVVLACISHFYLYQPYLT